jgi:hypothetical protein
MRLPDWHHRLDLLFLQRMRHPFVWGRHDCCLWAADCIEACTGRDAGGPYRGRYSSALGAARVLRAVGGPSGAATVACGAAVEPWRAAVGDLGLVDAGKGRDALAVCGGQHWFAAGETGLVTLPFDAASRCWKVE